ncbi:MAG: hypothetical protein QG656_83, partial [Candidatus Hydrogenedentes bacterium]|nr:hypothetical protein [Candidatus Hydrogenedentota bacterium]
MKTGLNLEFARTERLTPEQAMARAAAAGYRWVEPYVYSDVVLPVNSHLSVRTTSPYHHFHSGQTDPAELNALCKDLNLSFSAIDAHSTLLLPQIGVPYLKAAIDFA